MTAPAKMPRWVVVIPTAAIGFPDRVLLRFNAPDKTAACDILAAGKRDGSIDPDAVIMADADNQLLAASFANRAARTAKAARIARHRPRRPY